MIPKRAYAMWFGDEINEVLQLCLKSFIVLHPDIELTLYVNNANIKVLPEIKTEYMDLQKQDLIITDDMPSDNIEELKIGVASDYYRAQWLKHGGIYIDTDAFFIKPIYDLLNTDEDIIVSYILPGKLTSAVMLSSGENTETFFEELSQKQRKNKNFHRSLSIFRHYLAGYASHPAAKVKAIDYEKGFFYPKWDNFDELMTENPEYNCYAHHLFYSCADGKKLVEHLENRNNCNCYICRKFKEVENK